MKNYNLEIIAGPCSITPENTEEIINHIATITTPDGNRAIFGTRVVGLKSRTSLSDDGKGMGIDYDIIQKCLNLSEEQRKSFSLPSVKLAEKIADQTGLLIATEVMIPHIQLPFLEASQTLQGNIMIWNPAVEQLGWNILEMSTFANRNNWDLGIKHGKFLGKDPLDVANHPEYADQTSLETTLLGLTTFAQNIDKELIVIHRGVDVPGKGNYRNALIHEIMKRLKLKSSGIRLYFDPSHSFGPKMREHIVDGIIDAMKLKIDNDFLYDGVLIEAGTSPTDTDQHITIDELKILAKELSSFRKLREPKS